MGKITPRDVEALVELFDQSDWDDLHVELDDFCLTLSKRAGAAVERISRPAATESGSAPVATSKQERVQVASSLVEQGRAAVAIPDGWVAVRAPNLGTFYRSAKPDSPPFVEPGQEVHSDTQVCLIEVMKLFTAVNAGVHGIVRQVCIADGEMVEHDQPLFIIEPRS